MRMRQKQIEVVCTVVIKCGLDDLILNYKYGGYWTPIKTEILNRYVYCI